MENQPKREPAKDLFLHLLSAATLYISVIGFITLWWQYINFLFPDKLNIPGYGSSIYDTLLRATSMVAVSYPVYILVSWIIGKGFKTDPAGRESKVRKWLWYITLFIAAMTMVIDGIVLVFNFLKGDLTVQFFLKLIVILVTAAAVFGYYLWDLKKKDQPTDLPKKMAWITCAAIIASIAFGFIIVGSPSKQRALRFDEQRINDIQMLQNAILNYWQRKNSLPKDLDEINSIGFSLPADPETGRPYEYTPTGELAFKLCADFKTEFKTKPDIGKYPHPFFGQSGLATTPKNWEHGPEHACFDSVIDKDFFKKPADIETGIPIEAPLR